MIAGPPYTRHVSTTVRTLLSCYWSTIVPQVSLWVLVQLCQYNIGVCHLVQVCGSGRHCSYSKASQYIGEILLIIICTMVAPKIKGFSCSLYYLYNLSDHSHGIWQLYPSV